MHRVKNGVTVLIQIIGRFGVTRDPMVDGKGVWTLSAWFRGKS